MRIYTHFSGRFISTFCGRFQVTPDSYCFAAHLRLEDISNNQGDGLPIEFTGHQQTFLPIALAQHTVGLESQHAASKMANSPFKNTV